MAGDLAGALRALVTMLEASGLQYGLGGAGALAVWAVPRATLDIDINVRCDDDAVPATFERLIALGVEGDPETATHEAGSMGVA